MTPPSRPAGFPTTQWSRVLCAGAADDAAAREALERLCHDYWYPLYAFARRRELDPETAGDLVQGFLADLIERRDLSKADPARGRFRAFLRTACSNYLARTREHDRAIKRGGGRALLSIDLHDSEGRYLIEPTHELTAERLFERRWALALLQQVLARLDSEPGQAGKSELYTQLRPLLEGGDLSETYRDIAAKLKISEAGVKAAVSRYRRRYRELLREEVARTVADPAEVDAEIVDLLRALA